MDQKVRTTGWFLTAILLIVCAFIFLVIGVSMLTGYPDKIWWIGVLLVGCSIVVGASSIKNYYSAKNEVRFSEEQMKILPSQILGTDNRMEVLASWFYSASEWKAFMKWERKKRGSGTFVETVLIMVLGAITVRYLKGGDWYTALAISVSIAILYGILKYFISLSSINLHDNKMPEVIITNDAVIVNGQMNRFYGNNLWLVKVIVKETGNFNILEITYCWNTGRGQSFDEIQVPIPKGSLKEAIFLQECLMSKKAESNV
jgi:hypothetical protein